MNLNIWLGMKLWSSNRFHIDFAPLKFKYYPFWCEITLKSNGSTNKISKWGVNKMSDDKSFYRLLLFDTFRQYFGENNNNNFTIFPWHLLCSSGIQSSSNSTKECKLGWLWIECLNSTRYQPKNKTHFINVSSIAIYSFFKWKKKKTSRIANIFNGFFSILVFLTKTVRSLLLIFPCNFLRRSQHEPVC